jgi:hypothetical protein
MKLSDFKWMFTAAILFMQLNEQFGTAQIQLVEDDY